MPDVQYMSWLNLRAMFYMVTPNETSFETLKETPNFVDGAIPFFTLFILLEYIILLLQGKDAPRINDGVNSITHGLLSQLHTLIFRPVELVIYVWIYNNFHFIDLPWNSAWVWFAGFILIDFIYYWFHRFSHESNIIWASHQVHHSSEEYNLSTALRQSLMQKYYSMFLYFPLALAVPPSIFYVHLQFNLLYQFWIHTEAVKSIGPLEYILNTASHHRVHHGRNPYCIDKNYGGTLIIWDRIFNTFQKEDEKVIFGLVHPNDFWSPLWGQFYHYIYIFGLVRKHEGVGNKLSAVFKGPGWEPGKPWRGLFEDLPEVEQPVQKYDSSLPTWAGAYIVLHFGFILVFYAAIVPMRQELSLLVAVGCILFIMFSLTSFGYLFDHRRIAPFLEMSRCVSFMVFMYAVKGAALFENTFFLSLLGMFAGSAILWLTLTCLQYQFHVVTKKVD